MKTEKLPYLVYDFKITSNFLPNGLNQDCTSTIMEENGHLNDNVMSSYYENYIQIPNVNEDLNIHDGLYRKIIIHEYENLKINDDDVFLYPIEPYANLNHFLGSVHTYSKKPSVEYISEKALKELQNPNNNFYLIVSYPNEGTLFEHCFDYLYVIAERYKIPRKKIIFIIACADLDDLHQQYIEEKGIDKNDTIKTFYWTWSLRQKVAEADKIKKGQEMYNIDGSVSTIVIEKDLDENIKRNKKFMMFNRRMRSHRVVLTSLFGKDFIDRNLISYDYNHLGDDPVLELFRERVAEKYCQLGVDNMKQLIKEKPVSKVDYENPFNTIGFGCEYKEPYLDSYIHIISETNFETPGMYFSEKTWKPILNFQPFISVNYQYSLKYLKELGFKTFHPFIDESYDNEEDPIKRMTMIYDEVKRLDSLSIEEIHEWYYSVKDILIHNNNTAYKYQGKYQIDIEQKYLNKIVDYVKSS